MQKKRKESSDDKVREDAKEAEPESGTRKKSVDEEIQLMAADLRARAASLDPAQLEEGIERIKVRLIEKSAKLAPEELRPKIREGLRNHVEHDITVKGLFDDLRRRDRSALPRDDP